MFLVGVRKRVWNTESGVNDQSAINRCSKPGDVSVPEKGALLLNQGELVTETLPRLNRALCDVRRAVGPA